MSWEHCGAGESPAYTLSTLYQFRQQGCPAG